MKVRPYIAAASSGSTAKQFIPQENHGTVRLQLGDQLEMGT